MSNNSISDDEMERRATALRSELGFCAVEKIDGLKALQALKQQRYLRDYVIAPDASLAGSGRFNADERTIYLSQSTIDGLRRDEGRALFTVAHEIGHFALGHSSRNRSASNVADGKFNSQLNREEIDANRFAVAFLAPEDLANVTPASAVEELCGRFGLSLEAATKRHAELLRRYNQRYDVKRELPAGVLDFLAESARRGLPIRSSLKPALEQHLQLTRPAVEYVGDPCPNPKCGSLQMVRKGLITVCEACGAQTGID